MGYELYDQCFSVDSMFLLVCLLYDTTTVRTNGCVNLSQPQIVGLDLSRGSIGVWRFGDVSNFRCGYRRRSKSLTQALGYNLTAASDLYLRERACVQNTA
jgi:hypothetical protein